MRRQLQFGWGTNQRSLGINERIEEYKATITEANKDYNNGLLQTCVKVELETVNYNMIKVLSKVRELLENE